MITANPHVTPKIYKPTRNPETANFRLVFALLYGCFLLVSTKQRRPRNHKTTYLNPNNHHKIIQPLKLYFLKSPKPHIHQFRQIHQLTCGCIVPMHGAKHQQNLITQLLYKDHSHTNLTPKCQKYIKTCNTCMQATEKL